MMPLTLEQREYKEKTLNQLLINLPQLKTQLAQESRREVAVSLSKQFQEVEAHIARLEQELAEDMAGEPVADELCRQAAHALTRQKLYMAQKYINKLAAIEPFYPELARLKQDAESGHVSRRTRALAEGSASASAASTLIISQPGGSEAAAVSQPADRPTRRVISENGPRGIRQYFQFHLVASCLVVLTLFCVMMGIGGMNLLRWLIEGS